MPQQHRPAIVAELAKSTGVSEADVAKILEELGLSRIHHEAILANGGKEPTAAEAKIGFKIGRATVVV
jgi:hypothetical protein